MSTDIDRARNALAAGIQYRERGQLSDAVEAFNQAALWASIVGALDVQAVAELEHGAALYEIDGREPESMVHLHRAAALGNGTAIEAWAWLRLGEVHRFLNDTDFALPSFATSSELFRDLNDVYGEMLAQAALGRLFQQVGRTDDAILFLARAGHLALQDDEPKMAAENFLAAGELLLHARRRNDATPLLSIAAELYQALEERQLEERARSHLLAISDGRDMAQMVRIAELMVENAAESGDPEQVALANWGLGHLLASEGEPP